MLIFFLCYVFIMLCHHNPDKVTLDDLCSSLSPAVIVLLKCEQWETRSESWEPPSDIWPVTSSSVSIAISANRAIRLSCRGCHRWEKGENNFLLPPVQLQLSPGYKLETNFREPPPQKKNDNFSIMTILLWNLSSIFKSNCQQKINLIKSIDNFCHLWKKYKAKFLDFQSHPVLKDQILNIFSDKYFFICHLKTCFSAILPVDVNNTTETYLNIYQKNCSPLVCSLN